MSFKKGLGIAAVEDPFLAGKLAAERALEQNPAPDIAVMFASARLDQRKVFAGAKEALGRTPLFGSSSYREISNGGLTRHSAVILLLSSPSIEFDLCSSKCGDKLEETARDIVRKYLDRRSLSADSAVTCLLAGSEQHLQGIRYLSGIREAFPFPLPVSGGGSAGGTMSEAGEVFFNGHQYCGDEVSTGNLCLLFMKARAEGTVRFAYAYESSWTAIARPVRCTKTQGSVVFEVDHRPIIDYLKTYLGDQFTEVLATTSYKYSFIAKLRDGETEKCVIRTPGAIDFKNGSIPFFPAEDMQGVEIQMVQLSRDELVESARSAAVRARETLGDFRPEAVFVFSCHLRHKVLHSKTDEEIAAVKQVFGDNVPIVGFYCMGEYAPLYNSYEEVSDPRKRLSGSRQFSTSISIMALGSRPGLPASPERDYRMLLRRHLDQDASATDEETKCRKRIEELTGMLGDAEKIIEETESAFRYINNEHYHLTLKLQEKNEALSKANKRNEALQDIIKQYTPRNVWKKAHLSVDAGRYGIPDEEIRCTLLFLDIKGFTSYAEKHPPEEVIAAVNRIFAPATAIIYEHNGDVDKFIGDCIFAVFPSPQDAFLSALRIQSHIKAAAENSFLARIGINTGRVIAGNVGGAIRRDNTLIGDAVNLAQRLESNCSPGAILISGDSHAALGQDLLRDKKVTSRRITVKGKSAPVEVFEIEL